MNEPRRLAYIDALRGWAILLVILVHATLGPTAYESLQFPRALMTHRILVPNQTIFKIATGGILGVQLFFVVSALSLTLSWQARHTAGTAGVRDFFIRRFFRIAPMFYFGIGLYLLLFGWRPREFAPDGIGSLDVALTALFLHGWWPTATNSVVPGGWSIGAEAMFYLLLPALIILSRSLTRMWIVAVVAVIVVQIAYMMLAPVPPAGWPYAATLWQPLIYWSFPNQLPVFLFGILAADVLINRPRGRSHNSPRTWESWIAALLFVVMVTVLPFVNTPWLEPSLRFGACAAVLCVLLHRSPTPLLVNGVMTRIGRVSFSMYILHFALLEPTLDAVTVVLSSMLDTVSAGLALAVYYPLLVIVTFLAASITFLLIEAPFMRLGRKLIDWLNRDAVAAPAMVVEQPSPRRTMKTS